MKVLPTMSLEDFYKEASMLLNTYRIAPQKDMIDAIELNGKLYKPSKENQLRQIPGFKNEAYLVIVGKSYINVHIGGMQSLYSSHCQRVCLDLDTSLVEICLKIKNAGYLPFNSQGQCNPCRTVSISGIGTTSDLHKTLRELNVPEDARIDWGYF